MFKTTEKFEKAYQQLNPAQKEAVDQIGGPVMVVAGPGTGKTQVLTTRIANILKRTDTDPSAILALTFTESAAKNMRQRLAEIIGKTAYYVHISTFHSFCSQVIRDNPDYFPIERDSQPLTNLERYDLYENLIDATKLEKLKPLNAPYFYVRDIVKSISDLKREGVDLDDFEKIIKAEQKEFEQTEAEMKKGERHKKKKNIIKHKDLLKLYRGYQQQLRKKQRYDFDDMIALVVEAFSQNESLLLDYQERLHYFLVDEYQDTNTAQNEVVNLLCSYWQKIGENPNVFVVGDPNQAIYRFQGASVENMLGFVNYYKQAKIISLKKGYRCTQKLYDTASRVIGHNKLLVGDEGEEKEKKTTVGEPNPNQLTAEDEQYQKVVGMLKQNLDSAFELGSEVKVFQAPVQTLETVYVAEEIQKLIQKNVNPAEIAVLYRYNSDEKQMADTLEKWGIRFEIDGGDDVLKSEVINQLLNFFQVLLDLRKAEEDETLFAVLQYDWFDLDNLAVMKLGRIAGKDRRSILDILDLGYEHLVENDYDQFLKEEEYETIVQFRKKLYDWSQRELADTFTHWFELILKESGFLDWLKQQPHRLDLLNQINSLYNEVKALVNQDHKFKLADFLRTIEVMRDHRLKINAEDLNIREDAVHLSTVHKAKGREWDYVFIIHCVDKKWGNRYNRELIPLPKEILQNTDVSQKERNEDERRVFYVAITRARKQVVVTYPETVVNENQTRETFASQFITEIGDSQDVAAKELIENADDYLERLLAPEPARVVKTEEEKFFRHLVSNFKLSVTALNTYLRDKKQFVENTLLRVPRAKPIPMSFGTAVHQSLESMFNYYLEQGKRPDVGFVLDEFQLALEREVLTADEFKKRLKHGREIIENYYLQTKDGKPDVLLVERFFGSGWSRTILDDDIYLSGRVDRIDWVDRSKKTVRLVDYKTGKNKTKGFIEGTTKSANLSEREQELPDSIRGPYKRQLLFYKLLTELDRTFKPKAVEGVFDFVEPYDNKTGRLMPRKFVLLQEDVDDLKGLIKEVMKEIRSLEFLKEIEY
ncbi:MAG: ATP-dependent DNA helicase [Patescibacteria group bacterium]|nr:ATP-dependent DNA helicase [Patescibacteria group bacterium]